MDFETIRKKRETTRENGNPSENFYSKMRWMAGTLVDADGELLPDEKIRSRVGYGLIEAIAKHRPEQFILLKDYAAFIFREKYLPEAVRTWLLNGNTTHREFARMYGMNEATFKSQVARAKNKVFTDFGEWVIDDLTGNSMMQAHKNFYLTAEEIQIYRNRLLNKEYTVERLQNSLVIDLKPFKDDYCESMDLEEFRYWMEMIWFRASIQSHKELIEGCKEAGVFGYINYLTRKVYRTAEEEEAMQMIEGIIKGQAPEPVIRPIAGNDSDYEEN